MCTLGLVVLFFVLLNKVYATEFNTCYAYPVGGNAPQTLSEDLASHILRKTEEKQLSGLDLVIWLDTAKFSFVVHLQSYYKFEPRVDPKDGSKPIPTPIDSISTKIHSEWAKILFSRHSIFRIGDPSERILTPPNHGDFFFGLATKSTLDSISRECFARSVEPGGAATPLSTRRKFLQRDNSVMSYQYDSKGRLVPGSRSVSWRPTFGKNLLQAKR